MAKPIGPYSPYSISGNQIYVSGQIALDIDGLLISESIASETHQVMKNIENILKEAGVDFSDVIKATIFLKDIGQFECINEIYSTYLSVPYPARSTIEVSNLPRSANVKIECIALRRDK